MLQVSPIQAASRSPVKLLQRACWSLQALLVLAVSPSLAFAQELQTAPRLRTLRPEGRNIVITWEGGAGPYQLYTRSSLSTPWVEMDAPTDGNSITAVKTEQMAFFRVSSGRGNSTDRKAPSTPAGLRATPLTCNEVSLSWSSASDTGTGIKGYMVYRDGVFLKTVLAPDTSTTDTSTDGATTYSYSIRSYDFANNLSGLSAPLTVTTPQCEDTQPPTTPINIVATAVTSNQVDLRWQASADTGGSGLAGYLVYAGAAYIGGSSTPSYSARGLAAGQEHCFTVIAYDGNGNSSAPSVVTCARTAAGGSPANDNFATRLNLSTVAADANNLGASKEPGEPMHAGNPGGKSVWWTWTVSAPQYEVVISTSGSSFDTLLAVYKGSAVSGLTLVASNDNDPNGGVTSAVRFFPEAGATYAIAVDGKDGAAGSIRLDVSVCSMLVFPLEASFGPGGGNGTVHVGSLSGCSWSAMSLTDWVTVNTGTSGNGSANIGYSVAPNPNAIPRVGYIVIEGNVFMIAQQGAPCGSTLSHYTAFYGAAGGDGTVSVNSSAPDCQWTSVGDASWLSVLSGSSGAGNRDVTFRVAANTSVEPRTGTFTIAGQKFTVTQGGAACSYALSSNGASFPYTGGASSVNVSALGGCNWSVTSDREWLVVLSSPTGNGSGTVSFTVLLNSTTVERTGTLTIGGQPFRVTQAAGPCSFTVSPLTSTMAAAGGSVTVTVGAGTGCSWSAASQSQWITINPGSATVGGGNVSFTIAPNPASAARSGTLIVAGQTVTVNQAATPCSFTLSQPSASFSSAAASGSVNVTAGFDCNWNAVASAGWITITSGGSGPGNNTIRFNVAANPAATPRDGSITVAGRTFAISQTGVACSYSLSAPSSSVGAAGGSGSVNVIAPSGCTWNAVTNAPWLTITSARSGNGNATISFSATANTGASSRSATIVVGGQTHTVNQQAETTAPPAPTGLSALPASCSEVNLAWLPVTDQGGSGLRAYRVFRNGQFVREVLAPATSMTDSGLSGSTTYSYTVDAVDNAGNRSAASSAVSATTPVCPPPPQDWARSFGGSGGENGQAVAVDSAGNVILGGWFSGSVDFGGGAMPSTTSYAFFLAKYRPDGSHVWSKRFTVSVNSFTMKEVRVDPSQNIIIAGYFSGTAEFGGPSVVSRGDQDVFVAKFDSSGRHLWSRGYGGAETDMLNGLAVDREGNTVIAGQFLRVGNFGGETLGSPISGLNAFVAKYDPNGAHVWSKNFACPADHAVTGVAVDSANNVVIAGHFQGYINFGGGDLMPIMGGDTFLAKLSPAGTHIWSQRFGGLYTDKATAVTVDSRDNIIMTGIFAYYNANFGGTNLNSPAGIDIFIAKYNSAGAHIWSKSVGSMSNDESYSITTDSAQNVIVVGYYRAPGNFGGPQLPIRGGYDIFIAKYNANGEYVWVEHAGDTSTDVAYSVTTDAQNNVIVSGNFQGAIQLGSRTLTSAGSYDAFVYRRAP